MSMFWDYAFAGIVFYVLYEFFRIVEYNNKINNKENDNERRDH